ncbi:MAG: glycosyltransferase family 2 protein [Pseudomonadota bacterium]
MTEVVHLFAWLAAVCVLVPSVIVFAEVLASFMPKRSLPSHQGPLPSLVVIVPAHNEGEHIVQTLTDLKAALWDAASILVVADNCTDDTAEIAEREGAMVLRREDPDRRGKGFALQYAVDRLRNQPPECIAFFDADSRLEPDVLRRIASASTAVGRPVQAFYDMEAPQQGNARAGVRVFAWRFMNAVRMSGLSRLCNVTRFTGVGLAAPWSVIASINFGSAEITEDHALSFMLASERRAPILDADARVWSRFPEGGAASVTQRARWEHGSLSVMRRIAAPSILKATARGNMQLLSLALDGIAPPMMIFAVVLAFVFVLSASLALASLTGALMIALAAVFLFVAAIILGWMQVGRSVLPISALPGLGAFAAEKFLIYGRAGRQSSQTWTRTERDKGALAQEPEHNASDRNDDISLVDDECREQ